MYCSVMADLSRYERECDQREADYRIERQERITEMQASLDGGKPTDEIEFFGDVASLVLDCAANQDSVANALYKALHQAAERGEDYAVKALKEVRDHFIEVVL